MTTTPPQRRYPRRRTTWPAVLNAPDPCYGRVDVVGRGGALLRCPGELPPGEEIPLEICLAGVVIRLRARVVSCREEDGAYAVGVEFLDLGGDEASLLELSMLAEASPQQKSLPSSS